MGGETLGSIGPRYWSGTEFDSGEVWVFLFQGGIQGDGDKSSVGLTLGTYA